ncbi:MAG: methionyl-tRNA formyltransferase [Acidobacteriota bacterium]|nr:methionyl-tRNA formyltransferase [Acidobacteriota bacterium]
MKLVFLGSPPAAAVALRALHDAGHEIGLVVTQPAKRRGRGGGTTPTAVGRAADELGLPVTSDIAEVKRAGAELGVVVAYGRIIKPDVLAVVPLVNVHFSLLPRWREAAPVERAILAGDEVTGVCLMQVEEGLDTGGVYRRREVTVRPDETAAELTGRLADLGADLLVSALSGGLGAPEPQQGEPTYAKKIEPDELRLDWHRPAEELLRVVRLGRAWTTVGGRRLLVLAAAGAEAVPGDPGSLSSDVVATGSGGLRLLRVQPEGRRPMTAAEWRRGTASPVVLGS